MPQLSGQTHNTLRALRYIGIAAAIGLTTVTLSQCRMVQDNVTGLQLTGAGRLSARSACARQCNEAFEAALRAEERRHREAIRACGHDNGCKTAENRKHSKLEDKIEDDRKACKKGCYNEGGGHSGHDK